MLEKMHKEGLLRSIGISNFNVEDYEELLAHGITVLPVCNQFEVSPAMYRPDLVSYFQEKGMGVCASKSLGRGGEAFSSKVVTSLAQKYSVSPAQVFLRWGVQHGLVVASKTAKSSRMNENRSVLHFSLSQDEMDSLDGMTTDAAIEARNELELERKRSA